MMATWTSVPNTSLDVGKAARSVDIKAIRDNITALAEGASGAPKLETAAIEDGAVTGAKLSDIGAGNLGEIYFPHMFRASFAPGSSPSHSATAGFDFSVYGPSFTLAGEEITSPVTIGGFVFKANGTFRLRFYFEKISSANSGTISFRTYKRSASGVNTSGNFSSSATTLDTASTPGGSGTETVDVSGSEGDIVYVQMTRTGTNTNKAFGRVGNFQISFSRAEDSFKVGVV